MGSPKVHIYYDGACRLCSGLVKHVEDSSQAEIFDAVPTQEALPEGITVAEAARNVHAVDENGTVYKGADAVLYIISQYPRWRWLALVGRLPLIRQVVRFLYRIIADNRQRLGLIKSLH